MLKEQSKCLNNNLAKNAKSCSSSLDFSSMHDQDMNYYQESYSYYNSNAGRSSNAIDERPMLQLDNVSNENEDPEYDPDFDEEVNKMLEDINEDFLLNEDSVSPKPDNKPDDKKKNSESYKEQFEDYYDDFSDENENEDEHTSPEWFDLQVRNLSVNQ